MESSTFHIQKSVCFQEKEQNRADYYEILGKSYNALGDAFLAIENLNKALLITPKDEDLLVEISDALFKAERYREAVESKKPTMRL